MRGRPQSSAECASSSCPCRPPLGCELIGALLVPTLAESNSARERLRGRRSSRLELRLTGRRTIQVQTNHEMYDAAVEVATKDIGEDYIDELIGTLADFPGAVGTSARYWVPARISVPAESL